MKDRERRPPGRLRPGTTRPPQLRIRRNRSTALWRVAGDKISVAVGMLRSCGVLQDRSHFRTSVGIASTARVSVRAARSLPPSARVLNWYSGSIAARNRGCGVLQDRSHCRTSVGITSTARVSARAARSARLLNLNWYSGSIAARNRGCGVLQDRSHCRTSVGIASTACASACAVRSFPSSARVLSR